MASCPSFIKYLLSFYKYFVRHTDESVQPRSRVRANAQWRWPSCHLGPSHPQGAANAVDIAEEQSCKAQLQQKADVKHVATLTGK